MLFVFVGGPGGNPEGESYHHGPAPAFGYGPPPGIPTDPYSFDHSYRGGRGGYRGQDRRGRDRGPVRKFEEFKESSPGKKLLCITCLITELRHERLHWQML